MSPSAKCKCRLHMNCTSGYGSKYTLIKHLLYHVIQNTNISRVIQNCQGWKFAKSGNHPEIWPLICFCQIYIPLPIAWSYHAQFLASSTSYYIPRQTISNVWDSAAILIYPRTVDSLTANQWQLQSPKLRIVKLTYRNTSPIRHRPIRCVVPYKWSATVNIYGYNSSSNKC